ncbi:MULTISPECIES: GGDEF domain-containing protein [unclassified Vibrio]|uniref:diguanylate cyclase n=1 Tax=Vibrio sp. HB236076 TaxID=3232307 RepID=A0AB39HJS6_9VIBR|nr:GGDEF domain-containing protein [Vibrio sp. HB161653]MDP5252784.1 GGDEF domain-containing protein [Vibrio sp. HB161653]
MAKLAVSARYRRSEQDKRPTMPNSHYRIISSSLLLSRRLVWVVVALCSFILLSYPFDLIRIYQPLSGGPGTHPITALNFLLLALSLLFLRRHRLVSFALVTLVSVMVAIRLVATGEQSWFALLVEALTSTLGFSIPSGVQMGTNTAFSQAGLSFSILGLLFFRSWILAQATAIFALFLPFVSVVGYIYSIESFHGQMSLPTTLLGLLLGIASLLTTAHKGVLKAFLMPTFAAKMIRVQLICAIVFCLFGGYLFVQVIDNANKSFALYVVAICTYICFSLFFSGLLFERADKQRRQLERKLTTAAYTDPLTGVYNRAHFEKIFDLTLANKHKPDCCLLLIDIDHFKQVNDRFGHPAGDKVLQQVCQQMKSVTRGSDTLFRLGGEEFALLLPLTNLDIGYKVAEKIRLSLAQTHIAIEQEHQVINHQVTISIGCTTISAKDSVKEVIRRADQALYQAKALGRNQTCVSKER